MVYLIMSILLSDNPCQQTLFKLHCFITQPQQYLQKNKTYQSRLGFKQPHRILMSKSRRHIANICYIKQSELFQVNSRCNILKKKHFFREFVKYYSGDFFSDKGGTLLFRYKSFSVKPPLPSIP